MFCINFLDYVNSLETCLIQPDIQLHQILINPPKSFNGDCIDHFHWLVGLMAPRFSIASFFLPDLVHFLPGKSTLLLTLKLVFYFILFFRFLSQGVCTSQRQKDTERGKVGKYPLGGMAMLQPLLPFPEILDMCTHVPGMFFKSPGLGLILHT